MSHNQSQSDTGGSDQTKARQFQFLTPFQRKLLQKKLEGNLLLQHSLRIEIMLLADEGKTQTQICRALSCSQGTARHWILVARSGQAHNWQENPIGRPKNVNEQYLERLRELVNQSPRNFGYSFRHWTAQWLSKHLAKEFGILISDRHINRLLKKIGLSTRSKPATNKTATNQTSAGNSSLAINDLTSTSVPDSTQFWLFNSIH